jgi:hypothetical protein
MEFNQMLTTEKGEEKGEVGGHPIDALNLAEYLD